MDSAIQLAYNVRQKQYTVTSAPPPPPPIARSGCLKLYRMEIHRKSSNSLPFCVLPLRQLRHSSNDKPPFWSTSHDLASFLLHLRPRLIWPNTFLICGENSSTSLSNLFLFTSNWTNFHAVTMASERRVDSAQNMFGGFDLLVEFPSCFEKNIVDCLQKFECWAKIPTGYRYYCSLLSYGKRLKISLLPVWAKEWDCINVEGVLCIQSLTSCQRVLWSQNSDMQEQ